MKKKIGYKALKKWIDTDKEEQETIQKVYCEDFVSFEKLADYYETTPMVMRRIVMEMLGEQGYIVAKNQRKFNRKNQKKWTTSKQRHAKTSVLYPIIKLLIDSDESFFSISKKLQCSRERVGQVAKDCQHYGIKLNEDRTNRHASSAYYKNLKIRGYEKSN
jgi:hypothetical protein